MGEAHEGGEAFTEEPGAAPGTGAQATGAEEGAGGATPPGAEKETMRDEIKSTNEWISAEMGKYSSASTSAGDIGGEAVSPPVGVGGAGPGAAEAGRGTAIRQAAVEGTIMQALQEQAQQEQALEEEADKEVLGAMLGEPEAGIEIVRSVEAPPSEAAATVGGPEGAGEASVIEVEAMPVEPVEAIPPVGPAEGGPAPPGQEEEEGAGGAEGGEEAPAEEAPEEAPPAAAPAKSGARAGAAAAPKAAVAPPRARRKPLGRGFVAVAVVSMLVVVGLGGYFIFLTNAPPVAAFTYGPDAPVAGQQVTFDARNSSDTDRYGIKEYRWDFGDQESGRGRTVRHSYASSGDFTVTLTVLDAKSAKGVARMPIHLDPLKVTMAGPLIGDAYEYSVTGHASASNPEGLYTYSFKIAGQPVPVTIVVREVRLRLTGDKAQSVDDDGEAEDGFLRTHDVRFERTVYDIPDIQGLVMTNQATDAVLDGTLTATLTDAVCNEWDRPVRTGASIGARFTVEPSFVFSETDTGTFYNELTNISTSFSLPSFLRATQFNSEDRDDHQLQVGEGTYIWRVRGMERVEGRSGLALHVNVTMSDETRRAAGLDAFYTDVWLEPGLPLPAKDHVHAKAYSGGDTVIVDVTETMTTEHRGTVDVGRTCRPETHAYAVRKEYAADFGMIDLVPDQGGTGGGFALTDMEAVDDARASLPDFDAWLSSRPEAFCYGGNYSEPGGRGTWQLAFGKKGSSEHYGITARADLTPTGGGFVQEGRPLGSREGIGTVVSLSRGLKLMRNHTDVRERAFADLNPDWSRFNLTLGEGAQAVPLSPAAIGGASGSGGGGYVYGLESRDDPMSAQGRYRAALDATNGQILFSWTQKETREGKIGGGG